MGFELCERISVHAHMQLSRAYPDVTHIDKMNQQAKATILCNYNLHASPPTPVLLFPNCYIDNVP